MHESEQNLYDNLIRQIDRYKITATKAVSRQENDITTPASHSVNFSKKNFVRRNSSISAETTFTPIKNI